MMLRLTLAQILGSAPLFLAITKFVLLSSSSVFPFRFATGLDPPFFDFKAVRSCVLALERKGFFFACVYLCDLGLYFEPDLPAECHAAMRPKLLQLPHLLPLLLVHLAGP